MKAPPWGSWVVSIASAAFGGCAGAHPIPDPRAAVAAYADAAARGDADRIYAMLDDRSQKQLRIGDVRRIVGEERAELAEQARAITDPSAVVRARAVVHYPDGEQASLDLDGDRFGIRTTEALPSGGESPAQALGQLRRALARRSYSALLRVLTQATRSAIESDLRSLVEGLARPEGLKIQVNGDMALVPIEGGHAIRLRRESGLWKVEDFN